MLHFAAQRLQVQVVEYLLLQQLSLDDLNRTSSLNGNSALHFAAEVYLYFILTVGFSFFSLFFQMSKSSYGFAVEISKFNHDSDLVPL